jgi:demethylmenaquinone methyltransferase/2-methoxy-6-polyprenyl-1,4-benzoquinol methylase
VDDLYERQKRYYHLRAAEYDRGAWEPETAQHAAEVEAVVSLISSLPPARTLDVACGTGFLTRHLRGELTALDASEDMLRIAAGRAPAAELIRADAPPLPFPDAAFERVFSSHFYDHLKPDERRYFLSEARRVGQTLILVQQTGGPTHREGVERRPLEDGTKHDVYKVYFTPGSLLTELGGGELLFSGSVFLVARRAWGSATPES